MSHRQKKSRLLYANRLSIKTQITLDMNISCNHFSFKFAPFDTALYFQVQKL